MKIPQKLETAFVRHYKERRFDRLLRAIARTPHYLPEDTTKGRVAIFHGYSGHQDQAPIQHLVRVLKRNHRFTAITCDFPYHGLSNNPEKEADLGKIKSFRHWVYTVYNSTYKMLSLDSKEPLGMFLVGYSAGALAIIRFLQMYPEVQKYLAGIILVSVPLEVDHNASPWVLEHKKVLEPIFNMLAWIFPNYPVGDLPLGDTDDSLEYHGKVRARTAKELRDAVCAARAPEEMNKITVPVLFIHGDSDGVAPSGPVVEAFRSVGTAEDRKNLIVYKGEPHKILHIAVKDIEEWIKVRSRAKDWVPVQRERGVIDTTVKLSSILLFAIQEIVYEIFAFLGHCWKRTVQFLRSLVGKE